MIRGSCLCGAVKYELTGTFHESHHCHCSACRKAHGAAFATFACCKRRELSVTGADNLTVYHSSPPVQRSFCRTCGASLFFAHDGAPKLIWIAAGTLDAGAPTPDAHCFAASRASWWTIVDELPQHERLRPEYA